VMNTTLEQLVRHGLRAAIAQTPPIIGSPQVALEMQSGAPAAGLDFSGRYPQIPTESGGGLSTLTQRLGQLPIEEIADNVRTITERVKTLADSPQLDDSVRRLDHTLADLDRTVTDLDRTLRSAAPQIAPTLESVRETVVDLRKTASDIDATTAAARRMMNGSAAAPGASVQQALRELTDAARSIRSLADYLDQHPEALIRGRE